MDIIRISRAALAKDGMVKKAEEAVYVRPSGSNSIIRVAHAALAKKASAQAPAYDPMERIISAAMHKKADAGANWTFSTGASGLRPRKAIGVMAPPKPTPNVNMPQAIQLNNGGKQFTPNESTGLNNATIMDSVQANQRNTRAAWAAENTKKGMGAEVAGMGRWENGKYVNDNNGARDARRLRRSATGWWDNMVARDKYMNPGVNAKDITRGNVVDTRNWHQQAFGNSKLYQRLFNYKPMKDSNFIAVPEMGAFRAPSEYQTSGYDKTTGDKPLQTQQLQGDPNNRSVTGRDVEYDNMMRGRHMIDAFSLGHDPRMEQNMSDLVSTVANSRFQPGMVDSKGRWTGNALDNIRNSEAYRSAYSVFQRNNPHMDQSAFDQLLMAHGSNALHYNAQ